MAKVKSIKKIGNQAVYNMTVDKYHNYIIQGGVVSKNCDAMRYFCTWWTSPAHKDIEKKRGKKWSDDLIEDWKHASKEMKELMRKTLGEPKL